MSKHGTQKAQLISSNLHSIQLGAWKSEIKFYCLISQKICIFHSQQIILWFLFFRNGRGLQFIPTDLDDKAMEKISSQVYLLVIEMPDQRTISFSFIYLFYFIIITILLFFVTLTLANDVFFFFFFFPKMNSWDCTLEVTYLSTS